MPTIRTPTAKVAPLDTAETEAIIKRPVVQKLGNYNLTAAHNREVHELADGITAVLPAPSGSLTETDDWYIILKAMGATGATIDLNGQTVDGSAVDITLEQYETAVIVMNHDKTAFLKLHRETTVSAVEAALGLGTAASENIGTSGANVPLMNGANTWSATQTLAAFNSTGNSSVTGSLTVDTITLNSNEIFNTAIAGNRAAWYNANFSSDPVTNFPLGTMLAFVQNTGGATVQRNYQISSPQYHGSNNWWYHDASYSSGGGALSGTWVSRGTIGVTGTDRLIIGQRIA